MYKKIVVSLALDHGIGTVAIETARKLLDENGEIIAVHVIEQVPKFARQYLEENQEEKIQDMALKKVIERIGDANDIQAKILVGHPGRSISDYAGSIGADCIVVGSHKPGLRDFFLGSTAARVVRHALCSVHVLR